MEDEERILRWYPRPIMDRAEFIHISKEMFGGSVDIMVQRHLQEVLSGKYFERVGWYITSEQMPAEQAPVNFPYVYILPSKLLSLGEELYRRLLNEIQRAGGDIFPGARKDSLDHPCIHTYIWSEHLLTLKSRAGALLQISGDPTRRVKQIRYSERALESQPSVERISQADIDLETGRITEEEVRRYDVGLETMLFLQYSSDGLDKQITLSFDEYSLVYYKVKGRGEYHCHLPLPEGLKKIRPAERIKTDEDSLIYTTYHFYGEEQYHRFIPQQVESTVVVRAIFARFLREKPR